MPLHRPKRTLPGFSEEQTSALYAAFTEVAQDVQRLSTRDATLQLFTDRVDARANQFLRMSPPSAGQVLSLPHPRRTTPGDEVVVSIETPTGILTASVAPDKDDSGQTNQGTINGLVTVAFSQAGKVTFTSNGVNKWLTTSEVASSTGAAAGPAGAAGVAGATGATGDRGVQGTPGNDGADGRDGTDGLNGTNGLNGAAGPPGIPGNDGADGRDGTDGLNGAPGPTGATGVQGIPGNDGAEGAAGNDGQDGLPGSPGATGPTGASGPPGIPGNDGLEGPPGADGQDGLPGAPGVAGATGATGASGSNGAPGSFGSDGNEGTEGLQGMPGPAGPPGTIPPTRGIVLNATNMKLQVVTTTTATMAYESNYTDFLPGIFTPGNSTTSSSSASTFDIVPAIASANVGRVIHEVTILNTDTTFSQVLSVQLAPTPTLMLTGINLGPGERIEFTSDRGWRVFQSNGAEKSGLLPSGFTLTGEVTSIGNVATVTRSTDYSTTPWTGKHKFSNAVQFATALSLGAVSTDLIDVDVTSVNYARATVTGVSGVAGIAGMIALGDGHLVWIDNASLTLPLTLRHESTTETTNVNRIKCPGLVDYVIVPQSGVWVRYSNINSRWFVDGQVITVLDDSAASGFANTLNFVSGSGINSNVSTSVGVSNVEFDLAQRNPRSVMGNATNATANPTDIQGTTFYQKLRVNDSATGLEWGAEMDEQQCIIRDDFQVVGQSLSNLLLLADTPWFQSFSGGTGLGMVGTPTGVANHFGEVVLSTGATLNNQYTISKGNSLLQKIYKPTLVKEWVWIVSVDTITSVQIQVGLGENGLTSVNDTVIAYFSTAIGVNWQYFASAAGATANVDSGVPVVAGTRYKIRAVNIGTGWTFTINGASSATISKTPVTSVNFYSGVQTLNAANKNYNLDYCHLIAGPLSR